MLDYVYGHDDLVSRFVADLIPHCRRGFGNAKTIGIVEVSQERTGDDKLIAGLVFHNYDPGAGIIEISAAALPKKYWMTRGTIAQMYGYPFLQLGCQMVVQRVPADDERQLYMLSRYGHAFAKIPRMFGRERDGVICMLTYEDWIDNRFNKRLKHHLEAMQEQEAA